MLVPHFLRWKFDIYFILFKESMDFDDRLQDRKTRTKKSLSQVMLNSMRVLHEKMSEKYNCSQAYSELEIINNIMDEQRRQEQQGNKKPMLDRILLNDLKFMEEEEYMQQMYEQNFNEQLTDLFEYYKYYLQDPGIYFKGHYDTMHRYYERRKGHVYNELKKILTLSEVEDGKQEKNNAGSFLFQSGLESPNKKNKKTKEKQIDPGLANILAEITMNISSHGNHEFDESIHFDELKQKLIKFYGPPSAKSMHIIDSIYNFNKIGQDHLPLKNQQKFYHGAQSNTRKDFGQIVTRNFKKKNNCHGSNTSTRFMQSTNISNSQRCPQTSVNDQQFQHNGGQKQQSDNLRRQSKRRSGRRYKSTGNSQDASDLKIHVSQESLLKCSKNMPVKKSKLRRKSSDLIYHTRSKNNQWTNFRPLLNTQAFDSRHEQYQQSKNNLSKKKKHTAKVKSTEFNINNFNQNLLTATVEPYLQCTIAKFKRKIQQQKKQIINQKKAQTLMPQRSSTLKGGINYRQGHTNLSQHGQTKKKTGTKQRMKQQSTIPNTYKI